MSSGGTHPPPPSGSHGGRGRGGGGMTEYELQRAQRIQENRRKMEELGLLEASRGLARAAAAPSIVLEAGTQQAPPRKKRRVQPAAQPAVPEPTRLSRRLRGETALGQDAAAAAARAELELDEAQGRGRKGAPSRKQLVVEDGTKLEAPFTLWSIGVTVWELGHVHRGAWAHRYWSSSGCLYHHAYPVGYRASKVQFGSTYEMRIEEGPTGPVFKVIDQQTGTVFSGESPTKPWTDVCLAHRTGQRISGPLFFGFSDAITQCAIATNLYNEEELRAAVQGQKLERSSITPEEQAAQEFCRVEGIGEATAILLARSTALGGSRHSGLASLQAWASSSGDNAQAMFDYLTSSSELPESTRRWPAWRQRIAPRIVLAISGRWLGSGPAPSMSGPAAAAAAAEAPDGADQQPAAAADRANSNKQQADGAEGAAGPQSACQADLAAAPDPTPAVSPASARAAAVDNAAIAKENRQSQNRTSTKAAQAKATRTAAAAGAAGEAPQRSRRERKANSKFAEFLTDAEGAPE